MSANRAWVSCWYLGTDHNSTDRGKAVKCSKHTNNTYFVVSTARGLKNIREVLLLKLWFLFVQGECLSQFVLTKPSIWMDVSVWWAVPWQFTVWEERKREERGKERRGGKKNGEWDGTKRREEWISPVEANERWKYKEAVRRCGGLNRQDWQKQSSSAVECLNPHHCSYTPSSPHQSPLMISNITQSFVIALEPIWHCSPWLTLLSFNCIHIRILCRNVNQSQLGLLNGEGLSFWLKQTRWQQNILSAHSRGGSSCQPIYRKPWCIVGRHERLNGGTCLCQNTTDHVGFCACLSRIHRTLAELLEHSKHQFRHMFRHINTDADEQEDYTLGRRAQPIKRALFSHLMILKMLVFHWLKHSKQTWRGDPTNKQAQSVFSAVNTAQCESVTVICATAICVAASTALVCMCDRCVFLSSCHTVFSFVCVLSFLLADLCVCIFLHIFFYFYMCQRLYIHISACVFLRMFSGVCLCVSAFVCSVAGLEMWSQGLDECALCKLQMYVWKATSVFCSVSFRMTGPTTEEKYSLYFAPLAPLANV